MNYKIITIILFLISNNIFSQNKSTSSDDFSRISINTYLPDNVLSDFPKARRLLKSKIKSITSRNGMGSNDAYPRFVMSGNVNTLFSETLDGLPPKYIKTIEVTLSIGDAIEGVEFLSESLELRGVDDREDQAFISGIKKLSPRNKIIKKFVENAKNKIIEYYNSKCDFILKEAETLQNNKDYDNALSKLFEVPDVCKECFEKSMDLSKLVYKSKIENECQEKISQANVFISQDNWNDAAGSLVGITPDMECYSSTIDLQKKITDHKCSISIGKARGFWAKRDSKNASISLSEVSYDSSCYSESQVLFKEISGSIDAQRKKEWDLSYEKYNRDQIIKEEVHDIELELSRSDQQIKIQDSDLNRENSRSDQQIKVKDSDLNRENSRSDQQIKVKDAGVQRKIDMLSAEAKSYLVRKTADNQKLLIKTMGKTAIEVARANSKKSPPVYNYNVIK